ncbi:MAG TPA: hopanoid biosynthesis associated radical SAM protein HpnJ [Syntrophobacteraceae bacterium]|nr:hopanoid biosynthesis associated radical SAM protein HpnJ [Syntrophobacteraceae bacterium]
MKTLLLNPSSFEKFDAGASSRWPARREISSFWYPVWLAYPAGMIRESRLLDAPSHGVSPEQTIQLAKDYEFLVVFTSTPGFENDIRLAEAVKDLNPRISVAFVGPHVSVLPEETLRATDAIDFVVRKEFDDALTEFASGKKLEDIAGISFRSNGQIHHTPDRPLLLDLDRLPFAVDTYKRDLDITRYSVPFLLHPFVAFYTARGCPARCTFCLWPQTFSGHRWRTRSTESVVAEFKRAYELFPGLQEIFFDDDTFTWGKSRVLEICEKLKPLKKTWSCTCRVHADYETLKAMKEAGCRLLIVGFESASSTILRNVKKGATAEQGRELMKNCRRLGIAVHGDFIIGLPGETQETIRETIRFAEEIDCETIQVSIAHAFPGTEMYQYLRDRGYFPDGVMADELGHQLPNFEYPGLSRREIMDAVEYFYGRYYFRPRVIFRIVSGAIFDGAKRRRLIQEAREYLQLRARRKKFIRS